MLIFILKFSACLAIFLAFYKFLLEKETIHSFKRFYLIGALLLSFIIPSITFIEYVEPAPVLGTFKPIIEAITTPESNTIGEPVNYLPIILWSIYGLGVFLFGLKFCINLFKITYKIKCNPKCKNNIYTNVLLKDLITPHTFFNYIFLNKNKFETQQIPKEVLLHEQAHAKQKHSIDIIFIEVLQVLLWFNPLIYLCKQAIKLNHEFLADMAVLNHGIKPTTYQQMLLTFSSNVTNPQLANAINYSLIKKRFTIMKSETSRKAIWLRSLLMLPLLAGLLFSFSTTKTVEKEMTPLINTTKEKIPVLNIKQQPLRLKLNGKVTTLNSLSKDFKAIVGEKRTDLRINVNGGINMSLINDIQSKLKKYVNQIKLSQGGYIIDTSLIDKNDVKTIPVVNGIKCDNCTLFLSKKGIEELILSTTTRESIIKFRIKFPGKPTESIKNNTTKGNAKVKSYLTDASIGTMVQLFDIKTKNETLTPVMIQLVDKASPKYSKSPKVKKGELSDLPPPPPPPAPIVVKKKGKKSLNEIIENTPKGLKTGYKMINGESHYYITYKNGVTIYYNKLGQAVNKKGELLPPPPPPPPAPEKEMKTGSIDINNKKHYYTTINNKTRYYNRYGVETDKNGKELIPNKQVNASDVIPNANISKVYFNDKVVSEFKTDKKLATATIPEVPSMLQLTNKGAIFYYEGKKITGKKAIDLVDNNKDLNILIRDIDSKTPIVKLSKQPIRV